MGVRPTTVLAVCSLLMLSYIVFELIVKAL